MAKLVGTNVGAQIVPGLDTDTYATHSDEFGKGGYRAVQSIEDRDAISFERRSLGMEVRVLDSGVVYYLESFSGNEFDGVTEQVWKIATTNISGGEGDGSGNSEKEVFMGFLRDGKFWKLDENGDEVEIEGKIGCLYLDTNTSITYHYNESRRSFDKINTLSWVEVL